MQVSTERSHSGGIDHQCVPGPDHQLHESNRLSRKVAELAYKRHDIESEWAATTGSSQKLHLSYRLLSANNALNIALEEWLDSLDIDEYKRVTGDA